MAEDAPPHLRDASETRSQLTFDVGGPTPDFSTIAVSGKLHMGDRQLRKSEDVMVRIVDADGTIVAEGPGHIKSVGFIDKRNKYGDVESTERAHKVKLD